MKNRILLACIVVSAGYACWPVRDSEDDRGSVAYSSGGTSAPPVCSPIDPIDRHVVVPVSRHRRLSSDSTPADFHQDSDLLIEYGGEFWHAGIEDASAVHGFRPGRVIDRVTHALTGTGGGGFEVGAKTYSGRLAPPGIVFNPEIRGTRREAALELRTVAREGGDWVVKGNVAQRVVHGPDAMIEHVEFSSRGMELTWILHDRPEGIGIDIDVETIGMEMVVSSETGLHFGGPDGVSRVRVGDAVAVDSAGARLPIGLVATASGFRATVPGWFLDAAEYPVAIDPLIESEAGVDAPVPQLARSAQFEPAMASNGENVLVVWRDTDRVDGRDVFGARVGFDGSVIDVSGLAIATGTGDQDSPAVASDGTDYLVVWEDEIRDGDIFATRVDGASGELLDEAPLSLVRHSAQQNAASVAGMRGRYLVAWQDFRNNAGSLRRDIFGIRVDSSGELLDETPFEIVSEENNQNFPSVAGNGESWLVAWHDLRDGSSFDVYGTLISASGEFLTPDGILIADGPDSEWNVSVASLGSDYFVGWQSRNGGAAHDIFGRRIDASGGLIDPAPITICSDEGDQVKTSIAAVSGGYLAVWEDARNSGSFSNRDIYGARIGPDGVVVDDTAFALTTAGRDQRNPVAVSAGDHFLTSWEDFRNGDDNDIFGSRIAVAGDPVLDPDAIWYSTIGNEQAAPRLATNGTDWLVTWADNRNATDFDIYGVRVDGTTFLPVDETAMVISDAAGDQRQPAVASDGTDFLVTWADFRSGTDFDIYGARVNAADGAVSEAGKAGVVFKIDKNQILPDIAASTDAYFVVWQDERASANHDVYGIRVGFDGSVLDKAPMLMTVNFEHQHRPRVVSNGTDFLVVWEDRRNGEDLDVYGNLYLASKFAPENFEGVPIGVGEGDQRRPVVAAMGSEFVVAWIDSAPESDRLQTARVTSEGELDGPEAVQMARLTSGDVSALELASNGFNFLLGWELDGEEGVTIEAARLGADGGTPEGEPEQALLEGAERLGLGGIAAVGGDLRTVFVRPDTGGTPRVTIGSAEFNVLPRLTVDSEPTVFDEGADPVVIAPRIVVEDPDSEDFEGGGLVITVTSGGETDDRLTVGSSIETGISVVGNIVSLGGNPIGIFTGGRSGDSPLEVILTGFATPDAVQMLARSVTFQNLATPPANKRRVVAFTVSDGDDGLSNTARREISINTVSGPPVVTLQPESRTVSLDETVTLSVGAKGTDPLDFQWRFNGTILEGETNPSLVIDDITVAAAGEYDVVVSNSLGTTTSDAATLSFLSIDRCVTWNSVIGARYYVEGRFSEEDEWKVVSETIEAAEKSTQFCVPIDSLITLFKVNSGEAPPISDPIGDLVTVGISVDEGDVIIRWEAAAESLYSVHAKRSLGEPGWTLIESRVVPDGSYGRYTVDTAGGFHFFRVSGNP